MLAAEAVVLIILRPRVQPVLVAAVMEIILVAEVVLQPILAAEVVAADLLMEEIDIAVVTVVLE